MPCPRIGSGSSKPKRRDASKWQRRGGPQRLWAKRLLLALVAAAFSTGAASAEAIRIGVVKIAAAGPLYIAMEKGYFATEGLDASLVAFPAAEPIAVAAVSGDIDFGATGISAGLYSLAGQGALKIIAGQAHEAPGYQVNGFIVANNAFDGGLKSFKDLPGHSVAVAQIGSPLHYAAALVAEKFHVSLDSIRFLPLQANANIISAVIGGRADTGVAPATVVAPPLERAEFKLLGWIGDETPWQSSAVFTATKMFAARRDTVVRFLTAFRKGTQAYHDAFSDADERRRDGPTVPEIVEIIAKYTGQPAAQLRLGIAYVDAAGRLDLADMQRQIAWFKAQNMLKGDFAVDAVIDRSSVIPLPQR